MEKCISPAHHISMIKKYLFLVYMYFSFTTFATTATCSRRPNGGTCKKYSFKWIPFNLSEMCDAHHRTFSIINLYSFDWTSKHINKSERTKLITACIRATSFSSIFVPEMLCSITRWMRHSARYWRQRSVRGSDSHPKPSRASTTTMARNDEEWWDTWSPNNMNE